MGYRGWFGLRSRSGLLKIGVLVVAAFFSGTVRAAAFRTAKEGVTAPDFSLKSTKGEEISLSGLKGKVLVVSFVTQGQEKSERALQALSSLDPVLASKSGVLAVVGNPEDGDAAAWAAKSGVTFPVLLDTGKATFRQYGVFVTPATGVVRADGVFQGEASGYSTAFKGEVEGLLKVALGEASSEQVKADAEKVKTADETPRRQNARKEMQSARALSARNKTAEATEAAKKAIEADDSYGPAHSLLGNLLLDASDANADEAAGRFQKAVERSPNDPEAKIGMARVKAVKGDTAGAVSMLEEAARLNPKPQRVYYRLGMIYERAGKYEQASDAYRKALAKMFAE